MGTGALEENDARDAMTTSGYMISCGAVGARVFVCTCSKDESLSSLSSLSDHVTKCLSERAVCGSCTHVHFGKRKEVGSRRKRRLVPYVTMNNHDHM